MYPHSRQLVHRMDFTISPKATQMNMGFLQQCTAWPDEWFSDLLLPFFIFQHITWILWSAKSNIIYNAWLFAWVSLFLHKSTWEKKAKNLRKISNAGDVTCNIASFTGTTPLSGDVPKLSPSLSISPDVAKRWCFPEATGLFSLLKSWGVKTGMSWLDTLFNLPLSPPKRPPVCWQSSSFFATLTLASSSFSNS